MPLAKAATPAATNNQNQHGDLSFGAWWLYPQAAQTLAHAKCELRLGLGQFDKVERDQ